MARYLTLKIAFCFGQIIQVLIHVQGLRVHTFTDRAIIIN